MTMQELKIFEEKQIRTVWDEVQEKWYFCIIDIVEILTESKDYLTARKYWNKLKQHLVLEGNETRLTRKGRFLAFYMVALSCRKAPPEFRSRV